MKKHHILSILLIVAIFAACVNKQEKKEEKKEEIKVAKTNIVAKDSMYIKGENRFRMWLNDTLFYFHKWEHQKTKYVISKKVEVSNDSLNLIRYTNYKTNIDIRDIKAKKVFPNDLECIIYLLKEYKEMPKCNFSLSFMVKMDYYPSVIDEFSFEYGERIEDIKVQYQNYIIYYTYNRGGLHGKSEIKTNNNGTKDTVDVNYSWNDNKLNKIIINRNWK